ncbi:vWA domain-containing protein [Brevundimonas variabilis]|uniref:Ca-activated chloride channel family protein n=1 Tax=Brevundimonas variabilis TaxID=74312 RepID=A0A7W9CFC8_9CAUL|nr:von Willebrand factor type A domain-containing protein [Brevundimonas variabilis]MBB5744592.1 Ca-activated chloride channel family protein [Brevundimonas variabilis]
MTVAKQALTMAVGIGLLAPGSVSPVAPSQIQRPVRDGEATPAACATLGFTLPSAERAGMTPIVVSGTRLQSVSPPPTARPIEPTRKEDRVEYRGPPAAVPGPPPPPAPPAPPRPPVIGGDVTGSRIPNGRVPPPPPAPRPGPSAQAEMAVASPAYVVPGRTDTERYPDATPNPVKRVADEPVSTFSIDVDTASYANVRRFIEDGSAPPRDAVRVEEMINAFDYGYDRPTNPAEPFAVTTAVVPSPWSDPSARREIVHIGLQGYELPEGERRPLNLTFLVDVSGSMGSPDKLGLAQRSMNLIIDRLRPQDTVAVTYYAEGAGTTLVPTPGWDKLRMRCAVATLRAAGGTAGATGMTNAYDQAQASFGRDKVNRILMFTDGDFNVGVTDNKRLEDYVAEKRGTGIYLSVYGFGRGNYQDARMQTISQAGNGTAGYVADLNEARRLFGPAFDKGAFPIADDVKIQVEFNPARVSEYRLIGYETRLLNEEDFSNDAIDAGEVGSGASVTALYEITPVGGASQVPERRYEANRATQVGGGDPDGEVGFVQIRYKRPGEANSRLMQKVIANPGGGGRIATRPMESTRWALAVAAFGQKLRADPWLAPGHDWTSVIAEAQGARGEDPYGERADFVQLVRAAEELR